MPEAFRGATFHPSRTTREDDLNAWETVFPSGFYQRHSFLLKMLLSRKVRGSACCY